MTKVISLSNPAYQKLRSMKQGEESFSDVVLRMADKGNKNSLLKFAGAWSHLSDGEFEEIKKNIGLARKKSTSDLIKRMNKYDLS